MSRIATGRSLAGVRSAAGSGAHLARSGVGQRARRRWSGGFRRWSWSRECGTDNTRSRFAFASDHSLGRTMAGRRKMVGDPSPSVCSIPIGHRELRRAEGQPCRDHRRNVVVDRRLHVTIIRFRHIDHLSPSSSCASSFMLSFKDRRAPNIRRDVTSFEARCKMSSARRNPTPRTVCMN